jgi:hypothetical protein
VRGDGFGFGSAFGADVDEVSCFVAAAGGDMADLATGVELDKGFSIGGA